MIRLTDDLAVTADERQYILGRPRQRADKRVTLDNPGYYTTMEAVVRAAVSQALRDGVADGTITTLRKFLDVYGRKETEFARLLEPLGSGTANGGRSVLGKGVVG